MKKTYVWTDWVPSGVHYIQPNKCYEVSKGLGRSRYIIDEMGSSRYIYFPASAHLDGRAWNVVDRDIFAPKRKRHPNSDRAWTRGGMSGNASLGCGNLYRLAECEEVPEHLRKRYRALAIEAVKLRSELMDWFKINPVNSGRPDFSPEYVDLVKRVNEIDPDAACYLVEVAPFEEDWADWPSSINLAGISSVICWDDTPQGTTYWRFLDEKLGEQK